MNVTTKNTDLLIYKIAYWFLIGYLVIKSIKSIITTLFYASIDYYPMQTLGYFIFNVYLISYLVLLIISIIFYRSFEKKFKMQFQTLGDEENEKFRWLSSQLIRVFCYVFFIIAGLYVFNIIVFFISNYQTAENMKLFEIIFNGNFQNFALYIILAIILKSQNEKITYKLLNE